FDLAVRLMPLPDSSLIVRRVGSCRLVLCGSPGYLAAHGVPRTPSDLVNHNCLRIAFSPWGNDWTFEGPNGRETVHVHGNLEVNYGDALRLAAVHGQGLTLLPGFLAYEDLKAGRLVPVLAEYSGAELPISAVYPHRHHMSVKVRSFLDLLNQHDRENPA